MGRAKLVEVPGRYHHSVVGKLFPLVLILASLTTCGTSQNASTVSPTGNNAQAPALAELSDMLMDELERLGKDPSKTVAVAPSGSNNAVFDLSATIVDGSGIELAWTERIVGDYDQNAEVNLADLAPLALNWETTVDYDAPALHGGFARWPAGDPDGAGSANWRMARVDGDSNGEVSNSDITSIALHFQERIDGYRVYRKAPGESQFTMLPPPAPVDADVTIAHPANPGNAPVRYSLNDSEATPGGLGDGVYQYYVASYDKTSGAESPASGIVHVDIVAGTVNQSPVAQLSITPGFAGAPAEITLDASGSYDPDGTVTAYEWDFDADGVVDWLSTDPVPEESSSGTVDSITTVSPGVVTVTYRQGSEAYYFPSVMAVDNGAVESLPATEQLGISGWVNETVSSGFGENNVLNYHIFSIMEDPLTGEAIAAGGADEVGHAYFGGQRELYFLRRKSEGVWEEEVVLDDSVAIWQELLDSVISGQIWKAWLYWNENGQPGILVNSGASIGGVRYSLFACNRQPGGSWDVTRLWEEFEGQPGSSPNANVLRFVPLESGRFALLILDGTISGHYYVLWYDNGAVTIDDTGRENAGETPESRWITSLAVDSFGEAYCLVDNWEGKDWPDFRLLQREGINEWVEIPGSNGEFEDASIKYYDHRDLVFDSQNNLLISSYLINTDNTKDWDLSLISGSQIEIAHTIPGASTMRATLLSDGMIGQFANIDDEMSPLISKSFPVHIRIKGVEVLVEHLIDAFAPGVSGGRVNQENQILDGSGNWTSLLISLDPDIVNQVICRRVDPR